MCMTASAPATISARLLDWSSAPSIHVTPHCSGCGRRVRARTCQPASMACRISAPPTKPVAPVIAWVTVIGRCFFLRHAELVSPSLARPQLVSAHVCTPVTNAQLVCPLLLAKKHISLYHNLVH